MEPGQEHQEGCDVARCVGCGQQTLQCSKHLDTPMQTWTGIWPGVVECQEFGWYCYEDPTSREYWVQCDKDHPQAREDLNRLAVAAATGQVRWDSTAQRYFMR